MKITEVKTHAVSVPLKQTLWTAHEALKSSSVIITEVRTDDGLTGYGQIHGAPQKAICEWVAKLAEVVRGMDAAANVAVWEKLFALTSPRPGGVAAPPSSSPSAAAAWSFAPADPGAKAPRPRRRARPSRLAPGCGR